VENKASEGHFRGLGGGGCNPRTYEKEHENRGGERHKKSTGRSSFMSESKNSSLGGSAGAMVGGGPVCSAKGRRNTVDEGLDYSECRGGRIIPSCAAGTRKRGRTGGPKGKARSEEVQNLRGATELHAFSEPIKAEKEERSKLARGKCRRREGVRRAQ